MSLFQIQWQDPLRYPHLTKDIRDSSRSKSLAKSHSLPSIPLPNPSHIPESVPLAISRARTTTMVSCPEEDLLLRASSVHSSKDEDGSIGLNDTVEPDQPKKFYAKTVKNEKSLYLATSKLPRKSVDETLLQFLGPKSTENTLCSLGQSPPSLNSDFSSPVSSLPPCSSNSITTTSTLQSSLLPKNLTLSAFEQSVSHSTLPELSSSVSSSESLSPAHSAPVSPTLLSPIHQQFTPTGVTQKNHKQTHQQKYKQIEPISSFSSSSSTSCSLSRYLPHNSHSRHISCPCNNYPQRDQSLVPDKTADSRYTTPTASRRQSLTPSGPNSPIVVSRSNSIASITVLTTPQPSSALNISPVECHSLSPSTADPADAAYFASTIKKRSSFFASLSQSASLPSLSSLSRSKSTSPVTSPIAEKGNLAPDYLTAYFAENIPVARSSRQNNRFRPLTIASTSLLISNSSSTSRLTSATTKIASTITEDDNSIETSSTTSTSSTTTTTTTTTTTPFFKKHHSNRPSLLRSTFIHKHHHQHHTRHIPVEPTGIRYRSRHHISPSTYQPIMIPRKAKQTVLSLVTTEESKYGGARSTQSTVSGGDWGESSANHHENTQGFQPNSAASGQDPWMMVSRAGSSHPSNEGVSNRIPAPVSPWEEQISNLPPLQLLERREDTDPVLDVDIAQQIRLELPRKLRNASKWNLVYSSDQHGMSMTTLYHRCKGKGPMILAVKDSSDCIFGAFVTEEFKTNLSYYGTGESFLWNVTTLLSSPKPSVTPIPSSSPLQSSSTPVTPAERSISSNQSELLAAMNDHIGNVAGSPSSLSAPQSHQSGLSPSASPSSRPSSANGTQSRKKKKQKVVRFWKWTGKNDYVILSEPGFLGLGGGDGKFGLWIHADLERGHSDRCETFDNDPLASSCRHPVRPEDLKKAPTPAKNDANSRSGSPKNDKEEFYCQTVEIWSMIL